MELADCRENRSASNSFVGKEREKDEEIHAAFPVGFTPHITTGWWAGGARRADEERAEGEEGRGNVSEREGVERKGLAMA